MYIIATKQTKSETKIVAVYATQSDTWITYQRDMLAIM